MEKMKIAIVGTVASSIFGFRMPYINLLLEQGHEVFAFAIDFNSEQKQRLLDLGITPVDYNISRSGKGLLLFLSEIKELRLKLEEVQPDIFFGYFLKPVLFGGIAAKIAKVPKRVGLIEGLGQTFTVPPNGLSLKQRVLMKVLSLGIGFVSRLLDSIIVLNSDDQLELAKYASLSKIKLLGGIGVDLNEYSYKSISSDDKIRFLFVGRLLQEKGVRYFLEAADKVKKNYPNAEFLLIGALDESSSSGITKEELNSYTDSGVVKHYGHVTNVIDYIEKSSVFVLPSYYREGVPRSTQEAMAVGRAIITTDNTGCRDTVVDNVNGFLVNKYDSSDLATKMELYLNNPALIKMHGKNSRRLAEERFDVVNVNQRLLRFMYG
ncbi:TPA: glycosyltransferase family 4 protein [Vibrio vulnificus]|uniref:glycosyltransferase family 4 protein n=1 Tax=Vibrio vulnificus TaxID=672 RepID=UPI001A337063|nr:glycosyltransferase family 4 protein [Vibrio vulnificus]HAS6398259.1 glycosyltransferase [Vibrio vulnificus]HAS6405324.1 glycosyltransferase [Vibrio vulnificus]HDY7478604.1 glycosyltransferase family 4 protein [Vibrio vulnificus]